MTEPPNILQRKVLQVLAEAHEPPLTPDQIRSRTSYTPFAVRWALRWALANHVITKAPGSTEAFYINASGRALLNPHPHLTARPAVQVVDASGRSSHGAGPIPDDVIEAARAALATDGADTFRLLDVSVRRPDARPNVITYTFVHAAPVQP